MSITLYIQEGCSKSAEAERLLDEAGQEFRIVDLTKNPPTPEKLLELAHKAEVPLVNFLRADAQSTESNMTNGDHDSEKVFAKWLSKHPESIQRPIAESDTLAIIARPPERVISIIHST